MAGLAITHILGIDLSSMDCAQEIGGMATWVPGSAMRVGFLPDNRDESVYLGETPIQVVFDRRYIECKVNDHQYSFWRQEVKADPEGSQINKGCNIVISEYPYRTEYIQHALFKSSTKKGAEEQRKPPLESSEDEINIIKWINSLPYDYWSKNKYITAGILTPCIPSNILEVKRTLQSEKKFCYGVCDDYTYIFEKIVTSEKYKNILELTRKGLYNFWPSHVPFHVNKNLYLNTEVIDVAEDWLELSVRQAIAGPHNEEQSIYWTGKPVINNANKIYAYHLNRHNLEKCENKKRGSSLVSDKKNYDNQYGDNQYGDICSSSELCNNLVEKYNISKDSEKFILYYIKNSDNNIATVNSMDAILSDSNDPDRRIQEIFDITKNIMKKLKHLSDNNLLEYKTISLINELMDACEFKKVMNLLD